MNPLDPCGDHQQKIEWYIKYNIQAFTFTQSIISISIIRVSEIIGSTHKKIILLSKIVLYLNTF